MKYCLIKNKKKPKIKIYCKYNNYLKKHPMNRIIKKNKKQKIFYISDYFQYII